MVAGWWIRMTCIVSKKKVVFYVKNGATIVVEMSFFISLVKYWCVAASSNYIR